MPDPLHTMRDRLVIHHQTSPQAVEDFIAVIKAMAEEVKDGKGKEIQQEGEEVLSEGMKRVLRDEGKLRREGALGY
jgi:threonine aldolase